MKTGQAGLDLIKSFEGLRLDAYLCPARVWTIGYGHTGTVDGKLIRSGMRITAEKAEELLKEDLDKFERYVDRYVTTKITQNQFDALVSFAYNCGPGALQKSTLLKRVNSGLFVKASQEFLKWNKGGGKVLTGLTKRRKEEVALFMEDVLLKPKINLPLRDKSSRKGNKMVTIPKGKSVKVLEQTKPGYWQIKVTIDDKAYKGYCNAKYLQ